MDTGLKRYEDPEKIDKDPARFASKLTLLIKETSRTYENHRADDDVRNLAYYRGHFWTGDGHSNLGRSKDYRAAQNEVFPIVDTIQSSLAMDLPQCELLRQTNTHMREFNRTNDPAFQGRRVAACLNWMAEEGDLDEVTQEWVLHALIFPKGVVKTAWSASLGRTIWENKLPWEVFFDPNAKHPSKASWVFEYMSVHWSEWKRRLKAGVYNLQEGKGNIRPDSYPRSLVDKSANDLDAYEQRLRKGGLKEYVQIVEFWDFRTGMVHHIHLGTSQILMSAKAPYSRPYEVLVFHPGVGRIDGVSDVDLMAPVQRDINELVSARREIVHRLVRRMIIDRGLFQNEDDFATFKNAKTWEPTLVDVPAMKEIAKHIFVTPEMDTTYAFKDHLHGDMETVRRLAGEADYQRGVQKNIRTAAEFEGIRASIEGRMNTRVARLTKGVTRLFRKGLETLQWAVRNQEASRIDYQGLVFATQEDTPAQVLAQDILNQTPRFRLPPFSPLMEDKVVRRKHLADLVKEVFMRLPDEEKVMNWREVLRELVSEYGLRPSLLHAEEESEGLVKAETEAAGAVAGPPGMPPGMPGAPPPGLPVPEPGPPAGIQSGAPLPLRIAG